MSNVHGYCPHCQADLDGGSIWQTFNERHGEVEADRIAEMYGATRTSGKWGRAIGLYDMDRDRATAYRCPDCEKEWPR